MPEQRVFGRPPVHLERILQAIRGRIVAGEFAPGEKIPSIRAFEKEYGVSRVTMQRVITRLSQDGFTSTHVGRGTLVADHPPHRCRYGVVYPARRQQGWTRYFEALLHAVETVQTAADGRGFVTYTGIRRETISDDFDQLTYDVANQRVAGLLFTTLPFELHASTVLTTPGIPRVVIGPDAPWRGCNAIALAMDELERRALDYLKAQGKRRVAVICCADAKLNFDDTWERQQRLIHERGMTTRKYWLQGVNLHAPAWTKNLVHLLFQRNDAEPPDALLILDDNLVEPVTAGIVDAGLSVPDDLCVVAHTNYPCPTQAAVPVRRIGFDMVDVVEQACGLIDRQRECPDARPRAVTVMPWFADERDNG